MNRNKIIRMVQKKADTKKQQINASVVSRVASLVLNIVQKEMNDLLRTKRPRKY